MAALRKPIPFGRPDHATKLVTRARAALSDLAIRDLERRLAARRAQLEAEATAAIEAGRARCEVVITGSDLAWFRKPVR